jgi:hypothetical protein
MSCAVGQRSCEHDPDQARQQESAEHPSVEPEISQLASDHRQDGGDGERLERDEGNREHEADCQRALGRRPYPACRAGRRRRGPVRICAH